MLRPPTRPPAAAGCGCASARRAARRYAQFEPELIAQLLAGLTAERLAVLVSAPGLLPPAHTAADPTDSPVGGVAQLEPWFGTRYALQPLSEQRVARWAACRAHAERELADADARARAAGGLSLIHI